MEKLADYNLELSLLQLKYEHLAEMCRNLLKLWPIPDAKIPEEKQDSVVVKETSVTELEVTEVSEWDQLQSLLSKAQKVYAHGPKENPPLSLASTTCGSESNDCSLGIAKRVDMGSSTSSGTGLKSKSGSHSRANLSQTESKSKRVSHYRSKSSVGSKGSESGLRKKTKQPKELDALGVHGQVDVKHSSLGVDGVSGRYPSGSRTLSKSGGGKASKCESALTRESKAQQGFSIQQKGTQLSMPSKYYRLKKSVHRCIEDLEGEPPITSKAAATHFLRRLQPKDSDDPNCLNHIKLQLAVERTRLLKARLELVTSGQLPMAERSSWQDILRVKTKLDLIKQSYHSLLDAYNHTSPTATPNHTSPTATPNQEPDGPEIDAIVTPQLTSSREAIKPDISLSMPNPLVFSSLDEWSDVSKTEQQRKHRQWEIEYLAAVEENIVPVVSRCMNSPSPGPEWTGKVVSMIRTLHLVSQVPSKPIYLDLEQVIK